MRRDRLFHQPTPPFSPTTPSQLSSTDTDGSPSDFRSFYSQTETSPHFVRLQKRHFFRVKRQLPLDCKHYMKRNARSHPSASYRTRESSFRKQPPTRLRRNARLSCWPGRCSRKIFLAASLNNTTSMACFPRGYCGGKNGLVGEFLVECGHFERAGGEEQLYDRKRRK